MKNENEKPLVSNKQKERKNTLRKGKRESVAKERERTRPWELAEAPFRRGRAEAPPSGWHVLGDLKDEKGEPSTELEKKGCGVVT